MKGIRIDDLPPAHRAAALAQLAQEVIAKAPPPPLETKGMRRAEVKELHVPFKQWLNLHRIPYINARSDQRSTISVGAPDFFIFWQGKVIAIEFKWPGNKTTLDQNHWLEHLNETGTMAFILYDLVTAIDTVKKHLLST